MTVKRYTKDGKQILASLEFGGSTLVGDVTNETAVSIPVWILSHPTLSSRAVRLWAYMKGALNGSLSIPGTSHRSIATLLDVSDTTARRAIYELADAGAIQIEATYANGAQLGNIYYIWPCVSTVGVSTDEQGGVSTGEQGYINTNINTNINTAQDSVTPKTKNKKTYSDEFETMWKIYPRRINKGGALKAYNSTLKRGADASELLLAVKKYAADRIGAEEQYTLHAQTFFGPNERWRDYLLNADGPATVSELTEEQLVVAKIYDAYDTGNGWVNLDGETLLDNPAKFGYSRPTNSKGELIDASGVSYALDAQGQRRSTNYWK